MDGFIPEFSRTVLVDVVSTRGVEMDVEASEQECAALAERFGIVAVHGLRASAKLRALAGGTLFRVDGQLWAKVVQTCVVTLEPIAQEVHETFMMTFGAQEESDSMELDLSMDDADPPEPIIDGAIDLGEVVAEHLALALDPFPRKPGAELPQQAEPEEVVTEKVSPFAALARLKEKKK